MAIIPFGTWFTYEPPKWKDRLDNTSKIDLEKIGMQREELEELLEKLSEMGIVD